MLYDSYCMCKIARICLHTFHKDKLDQKKKVEWTRIGLLNPTNQHEKSFDEEADQTKMQYMQYMQCLDGTYCIV